jgi:hypothetical protein
MYTDNKTSPSSSDYTLSSYRLLGLFARPFMPCTVGALVSNVTVWIQRQSLDRLVGGFLLSALLLVLGNARPLLLCKGGNVYCCCLRIICEFPECIIVPALLISADLSAPAMILVSNQGSKMQFLSGILSGEEI